jgi:hypothetical protein
MPKRLRVQGEEKEYQPDVQIHFQSFEKVKDSSLCGDCEIIIKWKEDSKLKEKQTLPENVP